MNGHDRGRSRVKIDPRLRELLDGRMKRYVNKPALSPAKSTREMDGRLIPIVFVYVVDKLRQPIPGVPLELHDEKGNVIDSGRTSSKGFAILRFPARKPARKSGQLADGGNIGGSVVLIDGSAQPPIKKVVITPKLQVAKAMFQLEDTLGLIDVQLPPGDDPLARLPIDFSEDTCNDLIMTRANGLLDANNLTTRPDPLLSPPATSNSIAGNRLPLIRRLEVIRYGEDGERYLVRLRQEWILLTYTLGELASVTALDPGAVLQSARQAIAETSSIARDVTETARSTATQTLQDALSSLGSVDSVVHAVTNTSTSTGAIAGAAGFGIPGLFFIGGGGGGAWVDTSVDARVDTSINTSLLVNRAVQQTATLVNQLVSKAQALAQGVQNTATDVANHLAPLVSQVANALHWRVYEVYAVCTNVESVQHIIELPLFAEPLQPFDNDDLVAYRPFFELGLLDRSLLSGFDNLVATAAEPLLRVRLRITYDAPQFFPAFVTITLTNNTASATATATLQPVIFGSDTRTTTVTFNFTTPLVRGSALTGAFVIAGPGSGSAVLRRFELWFGDEPTTSPGTVFQPPTSPFTTTIPGDRDLGNVLLTHVNRNLHYYYGLLATTAIRVPSLRQDLDILASPGIDERFWQLPLLGVEGTHALLLDPGILIDAASEAGGTLTFVTTEPHGLAPNQVIAISGVGVDGYNGVWRVATTPTATSFTVTGGPSPLASSSGGRVVRHQSAAQLLDDPGAGTLVQMLAPGAYGEILTGLLQLPLDQLHPLLKQVGTFSPFGALPALPTAAPTAIISGVLPTATPAVPSAPLTTPSVPETPTT